MKDEGKIGSFMVFVTPHPSRRRGHAAMDARAESEAMFTGQCISPRLAMGPAWFINDPLQ
jgi:hypothetical protein